MHSLIDFQGESISAWAPRVLHKVLKHVHTVCINYIIQHTPFAFGITDGMGREEIAPGEQRRGGENTMRAEERWREHKQSRGDQQRAPGERRRLTESTGRPKEASREH